MLDVWELGFAFGLLLVGLLLGFAEGRGVELFLASATWVFVIPIEENIRVRENKIFPNLFNKI